MSTKQYTVIPKGRNRLAIIDLSTKLNVTTRPFEGTLISTPIVHGDDCTFAIETSSGTRKLISMQVPSGMMYASKVIS